MTNETPAEQALDFDSIAEQVGFSIVRAMQAKGIEKDILNVLLMHDGAVKRLGFDLLELVAEQVGKALHALEEPFLPVIASLVAPVLAGLFGAEIGPGDVGRKMSRGDGTRGAQLIVDGFIKAIAGDTPAEIQPSDVGARRIASAAVQASLESTFNALVPELLSDIFPEGIGHFTALTELPEGIIRALGVSRLVRRALQPIVTVCCTTPATWHMNKLHRPTLLTPALAVKEFLSGKWSRDQLDEELARQGYAPHRVEAFVRDGRRDLTTAEITNMISEGLLDEEAAIPKLRALGFDDETAAIWTTVDKLRRERTYRDNIIPLAIHAYAHREIDGVDLQQALDYALPNTLENNAARAHAEYARTYTVQHLSHAEVKEAIERGILAMPDYRAWLAREGYADEDALVLELLLDATMRGQSEADAKKAAAEAARAAEKRKRDEDAAKRKAESDAKKARTPAPLGDLERAVVLGILPIAVYAARLAELKFSADDIGFEVALLQQRREDYLAALERKQKAEGPPTPKTIALGTLERAVVRGVASVEQYRARLVADEYDAGDIAIMVQLASEARADAVRAQQLRDDAAAKLHAKGLSLDQEEKAVRHGLLSLDAYAAWLVAQGFDPQAAALLRASLAADVADAAAAAALRAKVNAAAAAKGIGLAALERAVKLGVRTREDYRARLVAMEISPDDQVTLLGILDAELAALTKARALRDAPTSATAAKTLARSDVEKAVRVGVLPIGAYRDYLAGAGYAAADVDVLTALLTFEVQDVALARQRRQRLDAGDGARQLARSDMEKAVRKGVRTLGDYETFVSAAGYAAEDQQLLVALLQAELDATAAAASPDVVDLLQRGADQTGEA